MLNQIQNNRSMSSTETVSRNAQAKRDEEKEFRLLNVIHTVVTIALAGTHTYAFLNNPGKYLCGICIGLTIRYLYITKKGEPIVKNKIMHYAINISSLVLVIILNLSWPTMILGFATCLPIPQQDLFNRQKAKKNLLTSS